MEFVYILQLKKDKKLYTGWTNNLRKRFFEHESGTVASTSNRRPLTLIYFEMCMHRKDALQREKYLKTAWGKRYIKNRLRNYLMG